MRLPRELKTTDRRAHILKLTSRTCSRRFERCHRPSRAQTCSTRSTARFRDGVRFRVVVVFSRGSELDSRTPEKITSSHALRRKCQRKSQIRARAPCIDPNEETARAMESSSVRRKRVAVRNFCVYAEIQVLDGKLRARASVETHVFSSSSACVILPRLHVYTDSPEVIPSETSFGVKHKYTRTHVQRHHSRLVPF